MSHSLFQMIFGPIHRWAIRRQTTKALSALSDDALKDIGLTRRDIDPTVEAMMRDGVARTGAGRHRPLPADAGPSLSSPGLYR